MSYQNMSAIMVLLSPIFKAICFILIQLILINVVNGVDFSPNGNVTHDDSQPQLDRSRRSLYEIMPFVLNIPIRYGDDLINIRWGKTISYIANEHLPIVTSSGYFNSNVMENVGEFVLYRDLDKCSAVVYFKELNALFGYIGMDYFISHLPYNFDENGNYIGVAGEPYILKRRDAPSHIQPLLPTIEIEEGIIRRPEFDSSRGMKRPHDSEAGPSWKHQRDSRDLNNGNNPEIHANVSRIGKIRNRRWDPLKAEYYLETLVFLTSDVAEPFKKLSGGPDRHIIWAVRLCIMYFHAVDSIFQKLRQHGSTIRINIAKIVIDDGSKLFSSIHNQEVPIIKTVAELRRHLHDHQRSYTPNSFDHVFMVTTFPVKHESKIIRGLTYYTPDMYRAHLLGLFYDGVPITVVGHGTDYAYAVHEISRTLNIKTDFRVKSSRKAGQCSSIMQNEGAKCNDCLKWNTDSREQFVNFMRYNKNRCFLLNKPRSLQQPGPSIFLSADLQCKCYGFSSHIRDNRGDPKPYISSRKCGAPLHCEQPETASSQYESPLPPFDGTRCGATMKVCWNGECTPRTPMHYGD